VAARQAIGFLENQACRNESLWHTWVDKGVQIDVARHRLDVASDISQVLEVAREVQASAGGGLLEPDLGIALDHLEALAVLMGEPMTQGEFDSSLEQLSKLRLVLCLGSPGEELDYRGGVVVSVAMREVLIKAVLDATVEG
jgi:hypothetical protein